MQTVPLQLSDVIYNAASQAFEALVTVHDTGAARSYACAIDAPITLSFEDAAAGLAAQAMRRHGTGRPDSVHMAPLAPHRGGRMSSWRRYALPSFGVRAPRAA